MHKICKHIKSLISQCMLYYIWILFTRETYGSSCRENKIKTPGDMQLRTHTLQVTFRSSIIVVAAPSSWCIATIKHFTSTNPPPPHPCPKCSKTVQQHCRSCTHDIRHIFIALYENIFINRCKSSVKEIFI